MSGARVFLRYWFLPETVARALRVTVVVAPILVIINHAEAVLVWEWTPTRLLKAGLTFLVPYAVSSWSSARALMQNSRS